MVTDDGRIPRTGVQRWAERCCIKNGQPTFALRAATGM
jgi:hypothetical protein